MGDNIDIYDINTHYVISHIIQGAACYKKCWMGGDICLLEALKSNNACVKWLINLYIPLVTYEMCLFLCQSPPALLKKLEIINSWGHESGNLLQVQCTTLMNESVSHDQTNNSFCWRYKCQTFWLVGDYPLHSYHDTVPRTGLLWQVPYPLLMSFDISLHTPSSWDHSQVSWWV